MPSDNLTLWLVRHADPLIEHGVCYGSLDVPADPAATAASAVRLQQALQAQGIHPQETITVKVSPLQRAQALSQALSSGWTGPALHPMTDPRLAEMDFGAWEGQRWEHIPESELSAWTADFPSYPAGGGESVHQFLSRVHAAKTHTLRLAAESGTRHAIWITHAGVIRAMSLLQGPLPQPLKATDWPTTAPVFGDWQLQCWPLSD